MVRATLRQSKWLLGLALTSVVILLPLFYHKRWTTTARLVITGSPSVPSAAGSRVDTVARHMQQFKAMYPLYSQKLYFYRAYRDTRYDLNIIRIFGIRHSKTNMTDMWCEWNSVDGNVEVTWRVRAQSMDIYGDWPAVNLYYGIMVTCPIKKTTPSNVIIDFVTIISHHSNASISLPVHHGDRDIRHPRETLAVCVKPITGGFDLSRMIEWIEIQMAAGISQFIFYNTDLVGAGRFVVDYYEKLGIIRTVGFPYLTAVLMTVERTSDLSSNLRYALYQQIYLVALQDCLYTFRSRYHYLLLVDLDEVLLPTLVESVPDMLHRLERTDTTNTASYMFKTAWHYTEFTNLTAGNQSASDLFMQIYAKAPPPSEHQPKSVVNTDRAELVNYHCVLATLTNESWIEPDWREYGYIHHFRDGKCVDKFEDSQFCANWAKEAKIDPVVRRYRTITSANVNKVRQLLQIGIS